MTTPCVHCGALVWVVYVLDAGKQKPLPTLCLPCLQAFSFGLRRKA